MEICSIIKLFCTQDGRSTLLSAIKYLLEFPKYITSFLRKAIEIERVKDLKSDDVKARRQYQACLRQLNDLVLEVEKYKSVVKNRPICGKERTDAILKEISCENNRCEEDYCEDDHSKSAMFDIKDKKRFPRTISFLEELDMWKKRAEKQYTKVSELFVCFEKEVGFMTIKAQDVEKNSKTMKEITRGGLATAGVVVGVVGGILTGGAGLAVVAAIGAACAGAGIGTGVVVSSRYAEKETTHAELKEKLEALNKKAGKLDRLAKDMDSLVVKSALLETNKDVVCRDMPLLIDLKEPFEAIFALMEAKIDFADFDELKKMMNQIEEKSRK